MGTIEELEKEISQIKERNRRVESDKAWETSRARKMAILVLTHIVATFLFFFIGSKRPLLDSLMPTLAFFLSTLTLSFFKKALLDSHK